MSSSEGGTFALTEANAGSMAPARPDYREKIEVEFEKNMEMPREQAKKLQEVVLNLNDKMGALLKREKDEFLAAYRAHTKKIQSELVMLRAKVAEEESSAQKDERVKQLQMDRDRFRREALRLDGETVTMKKMLNDMKNKLEVLEDDRNFLVKQLKASKQENEVLRNDLTCQQDPSPNLDNETQKTESSMSTAELLAGLQASLDRGNGLPQLVTRQSDPKALSKVLEPFGKGSSAKAVALLRQEYRGLQRSLSAERKAIEGLSRQVTVLQNRRQSNWLEVHFLECIRKVLSGIDARRREAEASMMKTRSGALSDVPTDESPAQMLARDAWGETPLRLDSFTASDRCSVIRCFLADDRVQKALSNRR